MEIAACVRASMGEWPLGTGCRRDSHQLREQGTERDLRIIQSGQRVEHEFLIEVNRGPQRVSFVTRRGQSPTVRADTRAKPTTGTDVDPTRIERGIRMESCGPWTRPVDACPPRCAPYL